MATVPCPVCGYHAPRSPCPHCGERPHPGAPRPACPNRPATLDGLRALPQGTLLLLRTPATKRLLIPPLLLTLFAFAVLLDLFHAGLTHWMRDAATRDPAFLGTGWLRDWLGPCIEAGVLTWIAGASSWAISLLATLALFYFTVSVVYEALCGPFLDEIQGRIEERWYGIDPLAALEGALDVPLWRRVGWCALGGAAGAVALAALWPRGGAWRWAAAAAALAPLVLLALADRAFGRWLVQLVWNETRMLLVSVQAAVLSGIVLLVALPLQLVPLFGPFAWTLVAGFAASLTILDIAFSRRRWTLRQRMRFLKREAAGLAVLGALSGLVFSVPLVGPLFLLPAASIGGQWFLCRRDKRYLRPSGAPKVSGSGADGGA